MNVIAIYELATIMTGNIDVDSLCCADEGRKLKLVCADFDN